MVQAGVTSGLVIAIGAHETESIPRGHCLSVQFEEPEPKPAPLLSDLRELALKRLLGAEERELPSPAVAVKLEQRVELPLQWIRTRYQAVPGVMTAEDVAFASPDLLAKICAAGGEKVIPGHSVQPNDRRCNLRDTPPAENVAPCPFSCNRELLSEKDTPPFQPVLEETSKRVTRYGPVGRCTNGPELVACAVAHEAHDRQAAYDPAVERKNRKEVAIPTPARDNDGLPSRAEVAPPGRDEFPGREDVSALLRERCPAASQFIHRVDKLDLEGDRHAVAQTSR